MREQVFFNGLIIFWFILAVFIFVTLFFVSAPYGRYTNGRWGATMNKKLGWVLMEAPAPLVFAAFFFLGEYRYSITALIFLGLWQAHYIHRAFIYPFYLRGNVERMTVMVMLLGIVFNGVNGYLNGRYVSAFSGGYSAEWLVDVRFIVGIVLFLVGFVINRWADSSLRQLRHPGETEYKIPNGGLYRWISCPNYLGEIVIWAGWAVATWSLAGLAFAVWTAANLTPRARANHYWYHEQFSDYPSRRRVIVPGIW